MTDRRGPAMALAGPSGWRAPALAALAGAGAGLGQAPFDLWLATPLGLAAVTALVALAPDPRGASLRAFAGGFGYFALTLHWIVEPFLVDVARHGWMAPFALVLFAAGLALFWAAAGWVGARMLRAPLARAAAFAPPADAGGGCARHGLHRVSMGAARPCPDRHAVAFPVRGHRGAWNDASGDGGRSALGALYHPAPCMARRRGVACTPRPAVCLSGRARASRGYRGPGRPPDPAQRAAAPEMAAGHDPGFLAARP